jgi:hypothetical protein
MQNWYKKQENDISAFVNEDWEGIVINVPEEGGGGEPFLTV